MNFDRVRKRHEGKAVRLISRAVSSQLAEVLNILDGQGLGAAQSSLAYLFKPEPLEQAFKDIYSQVGADFARRQYRELTSKKADPEPMLFDSWIDHMSAFAVDRAGTRIKRINQTTLNRIRRALDVGVRDGLSIDNVAELIERGTGINGLRGRVIARTEIVSASNEGSYLGAHSTGLQLKKEWISAVDERTRIDHLSANGQIVTKDEAFIVGGEALQYPGDPAGSAENVINCRCSIGWIPV